MTSSKRRQLDSGAFLQVDEERVSIIVDNNTTSKGWISLSSAVLNGGMQRFDTIQVLNHKVPASYDGVNPNPVVLLKNFCEQQGFNPNTTVGLLTAASMNTLQTFSRQADGVVVDVVVTAGISNARRAGASADYFAFSNDTTKNGTINTILITNAALSPSALVEAYAIAIEAKCAACQDLQILCPKTGKVAQGTGTDCAALLSNKSGRKVEHAGRHTLFAELIGQAVYDATRAALMTNIRHMHGNVLFYTLKRWTAQISLSLSGARPCVPSQPMMPVPWAPFSVLLVGMTAVLLSYLSPLPHSAQIILAVVAWDRYLGEPPLAIHPVVITGKLISFVLNSTPQRVFSNERPFLGFVCGSLLLLFVLIITLTSTWQLRKITKEAVPVVIDSVNTYTNLPALYVERLGVVFRFVAFMLEVVVVKSCVSLQLLCSIALQMAKFLERRQLSEARLQLSWLCSRDPSNLDSSELAGATLESLSENLSDGFVAPLFWFTLFGPLGAMGYRVINTLDSRIGYRGKFEWFGKPSARLDDILNLIPARVTTLLLASAAVFVPRCNAWNGLVVAWNDSSQCQSPNAGWPMGAMAGILGVMLEKKGEYCLGGSDNARLPGVTDIRLGQQVAQLAGMFAALLAVSACAFAANDRAAAN